MRARTVAIVVFEGVQGLDVFGPADVFYFANYVASTMGERRDPYLVEFVAPEAGPVRTAIGPRIFADHAAREPDLRPDVLLFAGGLCVEEPAADPAFVAEPAHRSPSVTTLSLEGPALDALIARAKAAGYTLGKGYGDLKEKTFRVGHMGDHPMARLEALLAALST